LTAPATGHPDNAASQAALGGIGKVDDVAEMVLLLLNRRSSSVTGENILVNGGFAA
jgi:NAD(P)-dependent dehydrogenase (short-subunit alcohol dehydrogenase family)